MPDQDFRERIRKLSPAKLVLLAEQLNKRSEAAEQVRREPVAIIGIGCRFPGGNDPSDYWKFLCERGDGIVDVPADRWDAAGLYDPDPDAPGKMSTRWGGFLGPVDGFDAQFFGIAPREAGSMDPQQRLLLEVAWEALERAGIPPDSLVGTKTGVFVGISGSDYMHLLLQGGLDAIDTYLASGTSPSIAAGRLAYVLGLQGPAFAVDTACSSSLVAIHQAVQSLRQRECHVALAGGVNLILSPVTSIALSKAHMMAPDGRCKTFDERADGFVRGEGAGIVVLKRLHDAVADRDPIVAVIRGSAINQDGRSNGLTAPNGPAQEAVLSAAIENAGVPAHQIGFVETHGTGTSLGDPIEVGALAAVLGQGRDSNHPVFLGAVKGNIGHLESAAGVAGLIKAALAVRHGVIPPIRRLDHLNPLIPWTDLPVRVATELHEWPAAQARLAGVSSFGFSGTNAHVVLGEAPMPERAATSRPERPLHLMTISARSDAALRAQLAKIAQHLEHDDAFADTCHTLNVGRAHFSHRAAVVAASAREARAAILDFLENSSSSAVLNGRSGSASPRIGFMLTGPEPGDLASFRAPGSPLAGLLEVDAAAPLRAQRLDVQRAMYRLWRSWGLEPQQLADVGTDPAALRYVEGVLQSAEALAIPCELPRSPHEMPSLEAALASAQESGCTHWIEIGSRLRGGNLRALLHVNTADIEAWSGFLSLLGRLYVDGLAIDWKAFDAPYDRRRVSLPTYAFQRERHWAASIPRSAPAQAPVDERIGPLLHQIAWRPMNEAAVDDGVVPQRWLIVPDGGGSAAQIVASLTRFGDRARSVGVEDLAEALEAAQQEGLPLHVLFLPALDTAVSQATSTVALMADQQRLLTAALRVVHTLVGRPGGGAPLRLSLVTRGSQAVEESEAANPAQATLWGMATAIAAEHPELRCARFDLDPCLDPSGQVERLVAALRRADREDQLAFRGARSLVRRLVSGRPIRVSAPFAARPDRAYLVTGGLRGLGALVASWLIERGARHLILLGRSAPGAEAEVRLEAFRRQGVQVLARSCDVSDYDAVAKVLAAAARDLPPLAGVIHAAGVLDDGVLWGQTWERFAPVLAPKVQGSWNLHQLTGGDLDFFVMFSSAAAIAGAGGQANYAAANAFEDALAWYRRQLGLPAVSINWGPWSGVGMAMDRNIHVEGVRPITPEEGMAVLERVIAAQAASSPQLTVLASDWTHLLQVDRAVVPPLFDELIANAAKGRSAAASPASARSAGRSLRERIAAAAANRRMGILRNYVLEVAGRILGLSPADEFDPEEPLRQRGLDSLMAVELRNQLGAAIGRTLPPTVTFDYPTAASLAEHIATLAFADEIQSAAAPAGSQPERESAASELGGMSEDQLAALLAAKLSSLTLVEEP